MRNKTNPKTDGVREGERDRYKEENGNKTQRMFETRKAKIEHQIGLELKGYSL